MAEPFPPLGRPAEVVSLLRLSEVSMPGLVTWLSVGSGATTINEDSAAYADALAAARGGASAGDLYLTTGNELVWRYVSAGHGYLVPAEWYDLVTGLATNASGTAYYNTDETADTLAAISARGFVKTPNGTSDVTQPGGAGTPLVLTAASGGGNYVYWDFVASAASAAYLVGFRVAQVATPAASSAVFQGSPLSGTVTTVAVGISGATGEPYFSASTSSVAKLADSGDADTGLLGDGTKWVWVVVGGSSVGYQLFGADSTKAKVATAIHTQFGTAAGPNLRFYAWGNGPDVEYEIHEFVALTLGLT